MKTNKTSKRALLTSVLSIALCLSMLIGTTFAWFTDTASTAVNKIQAGKLKVALEMQDGNGWTDANGKTLGWVQTKANGTETAIVDGKNILWEPGCEYQLQTVRVRNDGNLALKYKVVITGIDGDAKLNNAIEWAIEMGEASGNVVKLTDDAQGFQYALTAKDAANTLTISGKMRTDAGNEYQGLSIDGIGITVYATQYTEEYDSTGNQYDKDADMTPDNLDDLIVANVTAPVAKKADGTKDNTTVATADQKVTVAVPADAINDNAKELTLTVTPSTTPKVTVETNQGVQAYDISVTGLADGNTTPVEVKLFVGKGLKKVSVAHDGTVIDAANVSYNSTTGIVTFKTTSFSPFDVTYDAPVAVVNDTAYYSVTEAYKMGYSKANQPATITLYQDGKLTTYMSIKTSYPLTIDLNGHTLTYTSAYGSDVWADATFTVKNGTFIANKISASPAANTPYTGVICSNKGSTTTFENVNVETNASMFYPRGDASELNVINCQVTAGGYGIGTNAAKSEHYGIEINVKGSSITTTLDNGDNTAVYLNVPGILTIENSTITGDRQGMFVRGGTAVITNSTIATTGKFSDDKTYLDGYWGGGNELPCGALVLGNRHNSTAYDYATDCTLNNVTLTAGNGVRTMYVYANAGGGIGTTLTYDAACKLGTIVYGTKENVTVNAPAAK